MKKFKIETPKGVVENKGGKVQTLTGEEATAAFALRMLLIGLRTEMKTGGKLRMTRGPSCRKRVQALLGVRTNDYATLIDLVETRLSQKVEKLLIIDRDVEKPEDYNE